MLRLELTFFPDYCFAWSLRFAALSRLIRKANLFVESCQFNLIRKMSCRIIELEYGNCTRDAKARERISVDTESREQIKIPSVRL